MGSLTSDATEALRAQVSEAESEIQSLCSEIMERYEECALVYRLCDRMGTVLGEEAIAGMVLEEVARVLQADAGEAWLLRRGEAECVAQLQADGEPNLPAPLRRATLAEGRPWLTEPARGHEPELAVPIPDPDGEPLGVLRLRGRAGARMYGTGEMKLTSALATLTSSFIRIDRMAEEVRLAEARKREMELTRQIHRGLLPGSEPSFPGIDVDAACIAADNIGGDYYDYLGFDDGSLGLLVADVSGHGVGAALFMAAAKGVFLAEARHAPDAATLLSEVNGVLYGDFSRADLFATALFARLDPGASRVEVVSAGHHPLLLVRADGSWETLSPRGVVLGVLEQQSFQPVSAPLTPGDLLLLFTDGILEARDAERRHYGQERLLQRARELRHLPARELTRRILEDLAAHRGGQPSHDDVTLVTVKIEEETR